MGGKGAKERRRLQRLEEAGGDGQPSSPQSVSTRNGKSSRTTNDPSTRSPQKDQNRTVPIQSRATNHSSRPRVNNKQQRNIRFAEKPGARFNKQKNERTGNVTINPKQQNAKKKPKFKKPKHLKRKLENLDEEHQEERKKLMRELKQWEVQKQAKHPSQPKRQKTTHESVNSGEQKDEKEKNEPVQAAHQQVSEDPFCDHPEFKEVDNSVDRKRDTVRMDRKEASHGNDTILFSNHEEAIAVETLVDSNTIAVRDARKCSIAEEDSGSDSDSDVSLEHPTHRQRGRGRRGRKSTDAQTGTPSQPPAKELLSTTQDITPPEKTDAGDAEQQIKHEEEQARKKTPKKDDMRRCIGRKPVTDFVVGQRYPGQVVYIKPFGVFIDIGCHSDAFCHVSRAQDDYVGSLTDIMSIGETVSARVVEIDRKAKRVTVSLQSDVRLDDERASLEAKRQRAEKQQHSKPVKPSLSNNDILTDKPPPSSVPSQLNDPLDESKMTPAELKRARKLARRAARREQQAETGIAA